VLSVGCLGLVVGRDHVGVASWLFVVVAVVFRSWFGDVLDLVCLV